jgi:hypothetical protein
MSHYPMEAVMHLSRGARLSCCCLTFAASTLSSRIAVAQPEALPAIERGTAVSVTTVGGERLKGTMSAPIGDALTVIVGGETRRVAFDEVQRIERPSHRALIGAGIGAAASFAAACLPYSCKSHPGTDDPGLAEILGVVSVASGALIGAGAGASVDVLRSDRTLYERASTRDGIGDGVATGAFVGLVGGVVAAFANGCGHYTTCQIARIEAIVKGGVGMLAGAGVGALLDRANGGRAASAMDRTAPTVTVAPVFSRSVRGGLVSMRW